jgi:hypothetical protein
MSETIFPTEEHLNILRDAPETAAQFDEMYGVGASSKYIKAFEDERKVEEAEAEERNKPDDGFISNVIDGIKTGAKEGARETLETIESVADAAERAFPTGSANPDEPQFTQRLADKIPESELSDSAVENITADITQFMVGWITGGRALKLLKPKGAVGVAAKGMTQGAIADFVAFDEHNAKFSDLLVDKYPELEDTFVEYLTSDENDTWVEGKTKNAIEGAGFGLAAEAIFGIYRGIKAYRNAAKKKDKEAIDKIITETEKEVSESIEKVNNEGFSIKGEDALPEQVGKETATEQELDTVINFEKTDAGIELASKINKIRNGEMSIAELDDIPINFKNNKVENNEDFAFLTKNIYENVKDIKEQFDDIKPDTQFQKEVDDLIITPEQAYTKASVLKDTLGDGDSVLHTTRILDNGLQLKFFADSKAYLDGKITKEQAMQSFNNVVNSLGIRAGLQKGGGRFLRAFKQKIEGDQKGLIEELALKFSYNPDDFLTIAQIGAKQSPKTQHAFRKWLNDWLLLGKFKRPIELANTYWINALLSNPKTHAINMTSNLLMAMVRPGEQIAGGLLTRNKEAIRDGYDTAVGLLKYAQESAKQAKIAFDQSDAILDIYKANKVEANVDIATQGTLKYIQTPTRFLQAEDEFFKQINYRAKAYAKIVREAKGKNLSTKKTTVLPSGNKVSEFDIYVEKRMDQATDANGKATMEFKDALEYAQENTFTNDLGSGTLGRGIQDTVNNFPILRQIMPFVRTPVNIVRAFNDRLPYVGRWRAQHKKAINSTDPIIRAQARGKEALGFTLIGSAILLANAGVITGGVDKNRSINRQKFDTGWRPYSFKVGDNYISFERLDPLGMFFGVVADFVELQKDIDEKESIMAAEAIKTGLMAQMEVSNTKDLIGGGMMAFVRNLVSKTYLKSLSDALELLNSGNEHKIKTFVKQRLGSLVPSFVPALINDQIFREATEYTDTLKNRVGIDINPSFNAMGEPRYKNQSAFDALINPFTVSKDKGDIVSEQFVKLEQGFTNIGTDIGTNRNIDLNLFTNKEGKNAFVRYNEILQSLDVRGQLTDLIQSTKYDNATVNFRGDDATYRGSKVALIQQILSKNKNKALKKLQKENFTTEGGLLFKDAYRNNRKNNIRQKKGKELLPIF